MDPISLISQTFCQTVTWQFFSEATTYISLGAEPTMAEWGLRRPNEFLFFYFFNFTSKNYILHFSYFTPLKTNYPYISPPKNFSFWCTRPLKPMVIRRNALFWLSHLCG